MILLQVMENIFPSLPVIHLISPLIKEFLDIYT